MFYGDKEELTLSCLTAEDPPLAVIRCALTAYQYAWEVKDMQGTWHPMEMHLTCTGKSGGSSSPLLRARLHQQGFSRGCLGLGSGMAPAGSSLRAGPGQKPPAGPGLASVLPLRPVCLSHGDAGGGQILPSALLTLSTSQPRWAPVPHPGAAASPRRADGRPHQPRSPSRPSLVPLLPEHSRPQGGL